MRFHIPGGNSNNKYKFYIESSLNEWNWEEVVAKNIEFVNGWQTFRFNSKLIMYIKITISARNSDRVIRDFLIENFECPSPV